MTEHELTQEADQIRLGDKIAAFLKDEDVQKVFGTLDADYLTKWKAAEKPSERETLWAQSRALDDLRVDLQRVVDTGHRAATVQKRRLEKEARATRLGT